MHRVRPDARRSSTRLTGFRIRRLDSALSPSSSESRTNILPEELLAHPAFHEGAIDTGFLDATDPSELRQNGRQAPRRDSRVRAEAGKDRVVTAGAERRRPRDAGGPFGTLGRTFP